MKRYAITIPMRSKERGLRLLIHKKELHELYREQIKPFADKHNRRSMLQGIHLTISLQAQELLALKLMLPSDVTIEADSA